MHVQRNCARCGLGLTDAASRDNGVGPVCRKLDNYILATHLPADREVAASCFEVVARRADDLPEVARTTIAHIEIELASTKNRRDWRDCVKRLEWLLSFNPPRWLLNAIVDTVEALGYVSLAAVWLGEVCKSKALIWLKGSRLYVAAKRNKAGNDALKAIRGRRFHKAEELCADNKAGGWSVPATEFAAFKTAIIRHYPIREVDWGALEKAAKKAKPEVPSEPPKPKWSIQKGTGSAWMQVFTPYNADFVAELKMQVPYGSRGWNPALKCWVVRPTCYTTVRALCERFFEAA